MLPQGVRIYEVPISYTGREFDEGKKITWRDGFAALYAPVKFRFVRVTAPPPSVARWAAVVVHYHSGPLLAECIAALLADTSAGPGRCRGRRQRFRHRGDRSRACWRRFQTSRCSGRVQTSGTCAPPTSGIAATRAPIVGVFNPDALIAPGSAAAVLDAFASDEANRHRRAENPQPRRLRLPIGGTAPGPMRRGGARGARVELSRVTDSPRRIDNSTPIRRPAATSIGCREPLCGSGARRWIGRADGTSVSSSSWKTSTCAGVVRVGGGRVRYEPWATVMHVVGTSRAAQPCDRSSCTIEPYRYLDKWWTGPRRWRCRSPGVPRCPRRVGHRGGSGPGSPGAPPSRISGRDRVA